MQMSRLFHFLQLGIFLISLINTDYIKTYQIQSTTQVFEPFHDVKIKTIIFYCFIRYTK